MRKLFYILSLILISGMPLAAIAQTTDHLAHHSQKQKAPVPKTPGSMMMKSEKDMGYGCCNNMDMMQSDMMKNGMMEKKMPGMHCMSMNGGKQGCCAKMMGQSRMSTSHFSDSYQFNQ